MGEVHVAMAYGRDSGRLYIVRDTGTEY
jgi:hypothetical protein